MNKNGLNDILTVVLLVLVGIVAVSIIWYFVRSSVSTSSEQVVLQSQILDSNFIIKSVQESSGSLNIQVQRTSGDIAMTGFTIVLEDSSGVSYSIKYDLVLNVLESKNVVIDYQLSNLGTLAKVTIVPIFTSTTISQTAYGSPVSVSKQGESWIGLGGGGAGGASGSGSGSGNTVPPESPGNSNNNEPIPESGVNLCVLSRAYWSTSQTSEGDTINLIVEGNSDCDGLGVSFDIREDNLLIDSSVSNIPSPVRFSDGVAETIWSAEYQSDFFTDPEYYFVATILEDAIISISSSEDSSGVLSVSKSISSSSLQNYCIDSDQSGTLDQQSLSFGLVTYAYSECGSVSEVEGQSGDECSFILSAPDVCKDASNLYEQTCNADKLSTVEISCANGCLNGVCVA